MVRAGIPERVAKKASKRITEYHKEQNGYKTVTIEALEEKEVYTDIIVTH